MTQMKVPSMSNADLENKIRRDRKKNTLKDIKKIEEALANDSEEELRDIHILIDGIYGAAIKDWGMSMFGYLNGHGFNMSDLSRNALIDNLKLMKAKLEGFADGNNVFSDHASSVNVIANAENHTDININITFESAKEKLSDLTAISSAELDDLYAKIDELEDIVNSDEKKRGKWDKAKPIFKYLIDKGLDVAKIVLPLIAKL